MDQKDKNAFFFLFLTGSTFELLLNVFKLTMPSPSRGSFIKSIKKNILKNYNVDTCWHFIITENIFVPMSAMSKLHDMMRKSTYFCNFFNILYLQKYLYDIDISYLAFDSNYLMGFRSRLPTLSIWQPVKLNEEKVWSGGRLGGKDGNLCMLSSSYHKLALNWSEFFWNAKTFIQTKLQASKQY